MLQIVQDLRSGDTSLLEVPIPKVRPGTVLIKTTRSLVSIGTERSLVEFGKANIVNKARQQPEKVAMVLDKMQTEGIVPTLEAVFKKLDQPIPLGYCNVGIVEAVGTGVTQFKSGDRVVSNGPHAEFVCVPQNLVAPVPNNVKDEHAVFTVIGSIALQGVRLCKPTLGETMVVMGLGLIGLITAQLLKINGCKVIGLDVDDSKISVAEKLGIKCYHPGSQNDPVGFVNAATYGTGADGVIITASTKSNELISQAARMSRKRGRIILIGVIGLNLNRSEFYEKELTFQVSCSYGPGRYDSDYEEHGIDYPFPFVRWTENRNFRAVLEAMDNDSLKVDTLISEQVDLKNFDLVYGDLKRPGIIASILEYSFEPTEKFSTVQLSRNSNKFIGKAPVVAIIGAGNFVSMTMMPVLSKIPCELRYIASKDGLNGTVLAKKYGIKNSVTDHGEILKDPEVSMVIIATRHDQHAPLIKECLEAGKNTFVEKPLCLSKLELDSIIECHNKISDKGPLLTVGFNRRYAPFIQKTKELLGDSGQPVNLVITVNAGYIPENSWVHDLSVGGGRIIGEACHFIDLATFIGDSKITEVFMNGLGPVTKTDTDNATILLRLSNGSNGVINYFSNGNKRYSKERVEVHTGGKSIVIDNFRTITAHGFSGFKKEKSKIDKGHDAQFKALISSLQQSGPELIPMEEIINSTMASFAAVESLSKNCWIKL